MKILEHSKFSSLIMLLAMGAGIAASPASHANCDDTEILKADMKQHLAELCDAAETGDSGAMYWLGLAYIEGHVLDDYDQGVAWLKKAAFRGNEEAQRMYEFISSAEVGPGC